MKILGLILVFVLGILSILGSANPNSGYNSSNNYNNNFDASQYDLSKQKKNKPYNNTNIMPDTPINRQYNQNNG
jgi:hypothetical protein